MAPVLDDFRELPVIVREEGTTPGLKTRGSI